MWTLKTKSSLPLHPIGVGTWGHGTHPMLSRETDEEVAAIRYSLSLGQNHIDTAEMYADGKAEILVGRALQAVSRESVFLATKLWKNHVAPGTVRPAVEAMLKRLRTDYLDMLYIHAPWFDAPWQAAIPQIEALIDEGLVRHLGVSNFNSERLQEALELTSGSIAADQIHYSFMHRQEASDELRRLCVRQNIAIVAALPLEHGAILTDPAILQRAATSKISAAQAALDWLVEQGALPIPRALSSAHIAQNAATYSCPGHILYDYEPN